MKILNPRLKRLIPAWQRWGMLGVSIVSVFFAVYIVLKNGIVGSIESIWYYSLTPILYLFIYARMNLTFNNERSILQLASIEFTEHEIRLEMYQYGKYFMEKLGYAEVSSIEAKSSSKLGFTMLHIVQKNGDELLLETTGFSFKENQEIKQANLRILESNVA